MANMALSMLPMRQYSETTAQSTLLQAHAASSHECCTALIIHASLSMTGQHVLATRMQLYTVLITECKPVE